MQVCVQYSLDGTFDERIGQREHYLPFGRFAWLGGPTNSVLICMESKLAGRDGHSQSHMSTSLRTLYVAWYRKASAELACVAARQASVGRRNAGTQLLQGSEPCSSRPKPPAWTIPAMGQPHSYEGFVYIAGTCPRCHRLCNKQL